MSLKFGELETMCINMSSVKVKRYFHDTITDDSNVVSKPTNAQNCVKVYYNHIV